MSKTNYDYKVLVVTLGKVFVGKTSLSIRFVRNAFDEYQLSTVGAMHLEKIVEVDDTRVKVEIWDTAGAEQYEALTQQYWRNAHGAVCVYDVGQPESFERCKTWISQLRDSKGKSFPIALVGNKSDLPTEQHKVTREIGRKYAEDLGLLFEETSARNGTNVQQVFLSLVAKIPIPSELNKMAVNISPEPRKEDEGCKC